MTNNGDEAIVATPDPAQPGQTVRYFGNFHKTLPHNVFGEVELADYETFKSNAEGGGNYEGVAKGRKNSMQLPGEAPFRAGVTIQAECDKLNNPQAARARDKLAGATGQYAMGPAPSVRSESTAAEMTELQWMAMLRDVPFISMAADPKFATALTDVNNQFSRALAANNPGGLQLTTDLPKGLDGKLRIDASTLFRCGLLDEDKGPLISQFFLHDIKYGAQVIRQQVRSYTPKIDFLTDHGSWLRAQNSGYDEVGHGYSKDNDYESPAPYGTPGWIEPDYKHLHTMRAVARFVNKDALHQAYFNAALLCLNWDVKFDDGSPYAGYARQGAFSTFGGPDLLTRVSEVAGRALAIVWRQKWEVHRRLRPEAYGGLMQMQQFGYDPGTGLVKRAYGLPDMAFDSEASQIMRQTGNKNLFLPIAFSAGSPPHPSYGAGHATVAGACVTILKAWFKVENVLMRDLLETPPQLPLPPKNRPTDPDGTMVDISIADATGKLVRYQGADRDAMTVEGELNKIACNVAMGRSMGGVHFRSDNTRSLRLGEQIAAAILASESLDYAEVSTNGKRPKWSFNSFNGAKVEIEYGTVRVNGAAVDPRAGPLGDV